MNTRPNLKRLLFKLSALVDLGHEVTSSREYADRMRTALYVITGMFSIPRAALFIYDAGRSDLAFLTGKGVAHLADVRMGLDASDLALLPSNEPVTAQVLRNTGLFKRNAHVLAPRRSTGTARSSSSPRPSRPSSSRSTAHRATFR